MNRQMATKNPAEAGLTEWPVRAQLFLTGNVGLKQPYHQ